MIAAVSVLPLKLVFVVEGWATPPGCQGWTQIQCDKLEVKASGQSAKDHVLIEWEGRKASLLLARDNLISWSATEDRRTDRKVEIVLDCPHCGEQHTLEANLLQPIIPGDDPQAVAKCPITQRRLFLLPKVVLGEKLDGTD